MDTFINFCESFYATTRLVYCVKREKRWTNTTIPPYGSYISCKRSNRTFDTFPWSNTYLLYQWFTMPRLQKSKSESTSSFRKYFVQFPLEWSILQKTRKTFFKKYVPFPFIHFLQLFLLRQISQIWELLVFALDQMHLVKYEICIAYGKTADDDLCTTTMNENSI